MAFVVEPVPVVIRDPRYPDFALPLPSAQQCKWLAAITAIRNLEKWFCEHLLTFVKLRKAKGYGCCLSLTSLVTPDHAIVLPWDTTLPARRIAFDDVEWVAQPRRRPCAGW